MREALRFRLGLIGLIAGVLVWPGFVVMPVLIAVPLLNGVAGLLLGSWLELDGRTAWRAAASTPFIALAVGLVVGALAGTCEDAAGLAVAGVFYSLPWIAVVHWQVRRIPIDHAPLRRRTAPSNHPYRDPSW